MKRIVASVGLVAVGASGLQAGVLQDLTTESGKPWTASATLRGFYDDNINTIPSNATLLPGSSRSSFGWEVSPALQFSFPMEQTTLSFGAVYSLKYYENKPEGDANNIDQTVDINAALTHAFSERYQLSVRDDFVIGQEPDMLRAGNTYTTFQRISGDNMRNYGSISLAAQITPEFGIDVGYANTWTDYANDTSTGIPGTYGFYPSNAGLLNESDNVIHLDTRYQLAPQTIGVVGYQFRDTFYTGDQVISSGPPPFMLSDARNAIAHYGYIGIDENFRPDLTGSVRVGGRYTDYYNNPFSQNGASPYAMLNLKYTYLPESSVTLGFSYDYSPSTYFSQNLQGITLNAQAATVYVALTHRITPKLFGNIIAQYQNSTYYGGAYDGKTDNYYLVGLSLQYHFTPNFSAEVGYNFDDVYSEIANSYTRNRVYVGVTGSY
jgi:hypothetical protein